MHNEHQNNIKRNQIKLGGGKDYYQVLMMAVLADGLMDLYDSNLATKDALIKLAEVVKNGR